MKTHHLILPLTLLALSACDQTTNPPPASPGSELWGAGEVSAHQTEGVFSSPSSIPAVIHQPNNLLQNPSLESQTPNPWHDLSDRSPTWHPLALSTTESHTGTQSAELIIDDSFTAPTAILGIVQDIKPDITPPSPSAPFPTIISGNYKVTHWQRATTNQYLQAVIMAERPANKPANTNYPTYQLAIPLAGITQPPFTLGNRKFAFAPHNTPPPEPTLNQWIHFEFNLHDLYQELWGFIPERSTTYKVFFEVRYDSKADDQHPQATVYFDDLYLGTPPPPDQSTAED